MRMMTRAAALAFTSAVMALTASCSKSLPEQAEITILCTTDLHGSILSYDFNRDLQAKSSLSNISTYVKKVREENPQGVIMLDGGDFLQGQPSIYYSNFQDTTSRHIVARALDFIGYDAAAVGNHDIEPGESVYARVQKDLSFPWLAANAVDERTGKPFFQPYTIIERKGLRIAVLGMITPNIGAWLPKKLWENLEFEDMVECARKWVPLIQQKEKPDMLIGLFHSGAAYEDANRDADTFKNENGGIPAATKVDGFDLILLGHDHKSLLTDIVNDFGKTVKVVDAQTAARYVGRINVAFRRNGDSYDKTINTQLVEMADFPEDSLYEAAFANDVDVVNEYIGDELGVITDSITSFSAILGPSAFMDLIHNAQLWATGAQVSFAGVLSSNALIAQGKLTMRNLFTLYKYENLLYSMTLTGEEIRKYLEFGYDRQYNQMKSASDHLLNFKKDDKGRLIKDDRFGYSFVTPSFNFTSAAGIKYIVDVSRPDGEKVNILRMSDGSAFDPDKQYLVAINSYQASGGGDFFSLGVGLSKLETQKRIVTASDKDVRRHIADYVRELKVIEPKSRGDWKVIPQQWFEMGMKLDSALLKK